MTDAVRPLIPVVDNDPHGLLRTHPDELSPKLVAFPGSASLLGAGA